MEHATCYLLHQVLSFLAAHEAVRTCLLARRWRHLWKTAPALRVTGNEAHVNLWFRHAVMCGPRVTTTGIYEYPDDHETLGFLNVPLISQHLTRLEPLTVYVRGSTLDFSGCPALVHLTMDDCDIAGNISSPFLKHLSIVSSFFQTDPFRARICLPGLVSLELTGVLRRAPVLESMPLLVSAIVRLEWDCHDSCRKNDYGDCDDPRCYGCHDSRSGSDDRRCECVLLKGLSQVADLELSVDSQVFIVNRDLRLCPMFIKLKTLLLSKWCPGIASDLNVLSCFLKHSPILEKLILRLSEEPKVPVETQSYTPPEQSLACSHLEIV